MAQGSVVKEVMYIGPKTVKKDTVNNEPARVWSGLGAVQKVTPMEALNLIKHPTIWEDVTGWPEKKRIAMVASIREQRRSAERSRMHQEALHAASLLSDEELDQIKADRKNIKLPAADSSPASTQRRVGDEPSNDDGSARSRPETPSEIVDEIVGIILTFDEGKPELFDDNGHATLEAVTAHLGYDITRDELKAALLQLGG